MYSISKNSPYPNLAAEVQKKPLIDYRKQMTIRVTPEKIIREVQLEFSQEFPFLKIEFFKKGYRYKQSSQREKVLPKELKIGSPRIFNSTEGFIITESMTVKELERKCEEELGLSLQVYRKSGNLWLETTMTENWTLRQQNDTGREISI